MFFSIIKEFFQKLQGVFLSLWCFLPGFFWEKHEYIPYICRFYRYIYTKSILDAE